MLSFLIWGSLGALIGLLLSRVMPRESERVPLVYGLIGGAGAMLGGSLFDGGSTPNALTIGSVLFALVTATFVVSIAKIFPRTAAR